MYIVRSACKIYGRLILCLYDCVTSILVPPTRVPGTVEIGRIRVIIITCIVHTHKIINLHQNQMIKSRIVVCIGSWYQKIDLILMCICMYYSIYVNEKYMCY